LSFSGFLKKHRFSHSTLISFSTQPLKNANSAKQLHFFPVYFLATPEPQIGAMSASLLRGLHGLRSSQHKKNLWKVEGVDFARTGREEFFNSPSRTRKDG
jgi:hypothetical protein